jgi:CheY-like chemotaxis protein
VSSAGSLELEWRESDGPPVVPPRRQGFGTRVIRQGLEHQLRGHATLDFDPAGLHARLRTSRGFVPVAAPVVPTPRAEPRPGAVDAVRPVASLSAALVVEDDLVIALLAEAMLKQLGCERVLVAGNADDALRALATQPVDIALLDVNLGDHTSDRVALRLAELAVPTIVTTGYSDTDAVPAALRQLVRIGKPYTEGELADALSRALPAADF